MSDIAINPVTRRVQFTGNTGTGPFAFTFNVLNSSDIEVYKNTTLLTLTSDYTVSIASNGTGSVTLQAGQAVVSADYLTIIGGRDLERTTDFVTAGDLLASSLNEQLDSNVIMSQQLDESFGRSVSVSPGDVDVSMTLPVASSRASQVLAFTSTGAVTTTNLNDLPELTVDKLNVDNLTLDGNTISTTNTNGNLILTPNGTGDVVVSGDLVVNGTTTTIHSTVVDIADKNITIAYGSADAAAANGAGITVAGADATMNYYSTPDGWEFNKAVTVGYTGGTPQDLGGVLNVYSSSSSVPGMVIKSSSTSVDPKIQFEYSSQIWTVGQDSSSDDFKIINGTNLNSSAEIHINTDGDVALGGVSHYSNYELSVPQRVAIRSGSAVAGIDFASPTELVFDGNVGGTNGSFAKFRFVSYEADKMVLDGSTLKVNALAKVSGSEVSISDNLKFGDDKKAVFGDSTDLSVYFDAAANKSYISHTGSGSFPTLEFNTDGYDMRFLGNGYFMIRATPGADVKLMHAGSTKLETSASGVVITGSITADSYNLPGVLSLADGSNSAPSLTNTGDTNTGLYFPAADQVGLTVGGTQRLNVSATGIDVTGTVLADALTVGGEGIISSTTTATNLSDPILQLSGSGYTANGIYGIGFHYDTDSSGTSPVFAGYQLTSGGGNTKGNLVFGTRDTTTAGDVPIIRQTIASNGDISFYEDTGTTAKFFWDASAENLNIGAVSSQTSYKLHVTGTAGSDSGDVTTRIEAGTVSSNSAVNHATLDLTARAKTSGGTALAQNTEIRSLGNASGNGGTLAFYTDNSSAAITQRMVIDSSGNVGIGVTDPSSYYAKDLVIGAPAEGGITIRSTASNNANYLMFAEGTSGAELYRGYVGYSHAADELLILSHGAQRFYSADVERMRLDASGNLLLGTTTEGHVDADNLTISGDNRVGMTIRSANSGSSRIYFSDGTSGAAEYVGIIIYDHSDNHMRFGTAADETFRIDASGNMLVGTTDTTVYDNNSNSTADNGLNLRGDGKLDAARYNGIVLGLNRTGNDGTIVDLRKSGATVGSIGTQGGRLTIGDGATGLRIAGDLNTIVPWNTTTNVLRDAAIDLGQATQRFKDLYLSGGIYGEVTMPSQPAFSVNKGGTNQNNLAVGADVTITFNTEKFDVGANFASNTFTAPVTGKYQLSIHLRLNNVDSAATYYIPMIQTSNGVYRFIFDPDFGQDAAYWNVSFSVLADMDANDTAYITFNQGNGTAQTDVSGDATYTFFTGHLAC